VSSLTEEKRRRRTDHAIGSAVTATKLPLRRRCVVIVHRASLQSLEHFFFFLGLMLPLLHHKITRWSLK